MKNSLYKIIPFKYNTCMKYKLCLMAFLTIVNHNSFSQKDSIHNLLYLEVAGIGGYGSLNYERILFNKGNLMYGIRAGASTYHIKDYTNKFNPDILIPFSANMYYGKKHKIKIGVGQTLTNLVYAGLPDFKPKRKTTFHSNFSIGYYYQKKTSGIIFSCAYTPVVENNRLFRHWAGVSIGYSF